MIDQKKSADGVNGPISAESLISSYGVYSNSPEPNALREFGLSRGKELPAEFAAVATRLKALKLEREQERQHAHDVAALEARERWKRSTLLIGDGHPYLQKKGVQAHGLRVNGSTLLIPMRDSQWALWGLQSISADGDKCFMRGQKVTGLYHAIGNALEPDGKLLVCEGYATAATLHEQTGRPVAVAFMAGNLKAVAMALHHKYPGVDLVVCADDDWKTAGNPGLTKARDAALVVRAKLSVPDFTGLARGDKDTDFNDLARLHKAHAGQEVSHG